MTALLQRIGWLILLSGCFHPGLEQEPVRASAAHQRTVDIAQDDIVRIVTPYANPRVVTTSEVDIRRSQNVLYVLSRQNEPISMFVTDGENEAEALSLVLRPKESGKREVTFASSVSAKEPQAPPSHGIRPAVSDQRFTEHQASRQPAEDDKIDEYGKPCRLCRKDDTGDDHSDRGRH